MKILCTIFFSFFLSTVIANDDIVLEQELQVEYLDTIKKCIWEYGPTAKEICGKTVYSHLECILTNLTEGTNIASLLKDCMIAARVDMSIYKIEATRSY